MFGSAGRLLKSNSPCPVIRSFFVRTGRSAGKDERSLRKRKPSTDTTGEPNERQLHASPPTTPLLICRGRPVGDAHLWNAHRLACTQSNVRKCLGGGGAKRQGKFISRAQFVSPRYRGPPAARRNSPRSILPSAHVCSRRMRDPAAWRLLADYSRSPRKSNPKLIASQNLRQMRADRHRR